MDEDTRRPLELDSFQLCPIVRRVLGEPSATIKNGWTSDQLGGGGGEGTGLVRLTGTAAVEEDTIPWALILKTNPPSGETNPRAWAYPAREGLVYRNGLLESLPGGIGVIRCLGVELQPDGSDWIWLEAVDDEQPPVWSPSQFASAANCLGRFNGAYLSGKPIPSQSWLSKGWLRDFVEPSGPHIHKLERTDDAGDHPLVRKLYPPSVVAELRRLWNERERFLAALDALPQTFCHHDAFRRNVLSRSRSSGEEFLLIDWAYAGDGAVGQELVALVLGSGFFFESGAITPIELDATCFAAYLEGLREAGWIGDERLVRLGFTAAAALRYTIGTLQLMVPYIADPVFHPEMEALFRRPIAEAVDAWQEFWPNQFRLAAEARALLALTGH